MMSGPHRRAQSSCSSESTSTSTTVDSGAHAPGPPRSPRRSRRARLASVQPGEVVVLDQDRVVKAHADGSGRRRTGPRISRGPASRAWSCGCRRSRPASPATASTNRAVSVATPLSRWRKFSARPLQRQDRPHGAGDLRDHVSRRPADRRRRGGDSRRGRAGNGRSGARRRAARPARRGPAPRNGHAPGAWLGMVAVEVMSPTCPRSSASARSISVPAFAASASPNWKPGPLMAWSSHRPPRFFLTAPIVRYMLGAPVVGGET